ncbi:hypothetical protein ES703_47907 [subsurface metagenome]
MTEATVNPWEVSGKVDYGKLIKKFGLDKIDQKLLNRIKKHTKELHPMLRREIFFAHRDLNWVLDQYEKGERFFLYTGRASSGKVHLGHLMPWIFTKWLQDKFGAELWFQFPDEEKFLFKKGLTLEDTQKQMYEDMLDIIALGFDSKKTHFIIDTKHADLMYGGACKVAEKITFSMVKSSFGFNETTNIGAIFYTAMQAVPAFLPSIIKKKNIPCLIPHAVDQDPHFRLTRDILPRLGYYKPASIQCSFLPPLSGVNGKMSSSKEYAIYTTDSAKDVERKIKRYAFSGGQKSIEEHRKEGGNPNIDVSFQYLRFLFEPNDKKLAEIEKKYIKGEMLTSELKNITIKKINSFLKHHQRKRRKARRKINKFIYKEK